MGSGVNATMGCCGIVADLHKSNIIVVYCETIKRKLNRSLKYECRCDERLKVKVEGSTRLVYTGFHGELEHLEI